MACGWLGLVQDVVSRRRHVFLRMVSGALRKRLLKQRSMKRCRRNPDSFVAHLPVCASRPVVLYKHWLALLQAQIYAVCSGLKKHLHQQHNSLLVPQAQHTAHGQDTGSSAGGSADKWINAWAVPVQCTQHFTAVSIDFYNGKSNAAWHLQQVLHVQLYVGEGAGTTTRMMKLSHPHLLDYTNPPASTITHIQL